MRKSGRDPSIRLSRHPIQTLDKYCEEELAFQEAVQRLYKDRPKGHCLGHRIDIACPPGRPRALNVGVVRIIVGAAIVNVAALSGGSA